MARRLVENYAFAWIEREIGRYPTRCWPVKSERLGFANGEDATGLHSETRSQNRALRLQKLFGHRLKQCSCFGKCLAFDRNTSTGDGLRSYRGTLRAFKLGTLALPLSA